MSTDNTEKQETPKCENDNNNNKKESSKFFENIKKFFSELGKFIKNTLTNKYLMFIISVVIVSILVNYAIIMKYCKGKNLFDMFKITGPDSQSKYKIIKWMIILTIALILISIITFIILYFREYYNTNPILIKSINAKKGPVTIKNNRILKSFKGMAYSYSFWIYLDSWGYKYKKPKWLLYKCQKPENDTEVPLSNPTIVINPESPKISININTTTDNDGSLNEILTTPELDLQKWNHIVLTVNNQNARIYCNGSLCVGKTLQGTMVLNDYDLQIVPFGGYSGMLNNLQYFNYEIDIDKVKHLNADKPKNFNLNNIISELK